MEFRGFFLLQTPEDLLRKLRHDFGRLLADPVDPYAAFDFFVTAEHMLDWQFPGRSCGSARKAKRESEPLLRITSHIANGGKHFKAESKEHDSVDGFRYIEKGVVFPLSFPLEFEVASLLIELGDDRPGDLGEDIEVTELARRVLDYWDRDLAGSLSA